MTISLHSMKDKISQERNEKGTFAIKDKKKEEEEKSKKILNPRKIKILISIVFGNFFLGCCYALMAPIFPQEAVKKNASATAYGFIFGIYQLTMFLSSPVYGKIIPILKPCFLMKAGMFVSGTCNILLGFLDYAPLGPSFIGLALTFRLVDALGASAFTTASYTTLGTELAEIIGRAMSLTETAFALGLAGGPVLGGFLFELGGFRLPFLVIGLILVVAAGINVLLFSEDESDIPCQSISALHLLANIDFMIDVTAISTCFAFDAFNEISLEPHTRQFNLSAVTTGLLFFTSALTDAVCSPVFGYLAEKVPNAQYLTFLGSLLFVACFLIIGPAPFLNFRTTLWLVVLSQFLLGLASAFLIVCSFTHGMKHTLERGFPDEVGTYSVISGVLLSAASFGGFVGPSVGGVLIDEFGYINSSMIATALGTVIAFVCASRLIYLCSKRKNKI